MVTSDARALGTRGFGLPPSLLCPVWARSLWFHDPGMQIFRALRLLGREGGNGKTGEGLTLPAHPAGSAHLAVGRPSAGWRADTLRCSLSKAGEGGGEGRRGGVLSDVRVPPQHGPESQLGAERPHLSMLPNPFSFCVRGKFSTSRTLKKNTLSNVMYIMLYYIIILLLYFIAFHLSTPCSVPDALPAL